MPGLMAILRDVEPYEALQVLNNPRRMPVPVHGPRGLTYLAIYARTNAGKPVVVVIRHLGGHDAMIVAARRMTPADIALFEQWEQGQ
jgi:hypothetical protein